MGIPVWGPMWRARTRAHPAIRRAGDSTALVALVVALILLGRGCVQALQPERLELVEVVYAPVSLTEFTITPTVVSVGETTVLHNGICNNTDDVLVAEIYLAARRAEANSLVGGERIDLARRDDPGLTIDPGCTPDTIEGPLPATFTPGRWELVMQIIVRGPAGQVQSINEVSNTFEVRGAP